MRENMDAEFEASGGGNFNEQVDARRYEEAKVLFEKALELEPGNQRAIQGKIDCEEMLRGYAPVQHMVRVDTFVDDSILAPADDGPRTGSMPHPHRKMPWDELRERRRRDREGMAYTSAMFGRETENADNKVDDIITKALEMLKKDPGSARAVRDAAANEIEEFQRQLHRGWKGHGPEILDAALAKLDAAFRGIER
jgi:hypothetical protein